MRALVFALLLGLAAPAAAQPVAHAGSDRVESQLALAAHELAAIWRPLPPGRMTLATLTAACEGALEEMAALEAHLPDPMTVDALAAIRPEHGLVVVPTNENPTIVYLFPNNDLRGIASGLATFRLDPAGEGRLIIRDAADHDSNLQVGHAGGHALLRIDPRGSGDVQTYVGCASTLR